MIDDLQWGDVDSAVLLADLLYIARSAPPALHRLLSPGGRRGEPVPPFASPVWPDGSRHAQSSRAGRRGAEPGRSHASWRWLCWAGTTRWREPMLTWSPVSRGEILCSSTSWSGSSSRASFSECWAAPGEIDLDAVLWTRIQSQPEDAQRLLEVVSVSGRPILESLAFHAAELGTGGRAGPGSLRSARLVRGAGPDRLDQIEIYHDRIRETVLAHLERERLASGTTSSWRACWRLPGQADAEVLADHFRGAGESRAGARLLHPGRRQGLRRAGVRSRRTPLSPGLGARLRHARPGAPARQEAG